MRTTQASPTASPAFPRMATVRISALSTAFLAGTAAISLLVAPAAGAVSLSNDVAASTNQSVGSTWGHDSTQGDRVWDQKTKAYISVKTVAWLMPGTSGTEASWPQSLVPEGVPDCGTGWYQVDVYRYDTKKQKKLVDDFVADGILTGPEEDGQAYMSHQFLQPVNDPAKCNIAPEPTPEPTTEPTPEPTTKPTTEPEPTPEPSPTPTQKPCTNAPKPRPTPVPKPCPNYPTPVPKPKPTPTPSCPDVPAKPGTPTTPDVPTTPETPTTPDAPTTPETPATPDAPEAPVERPTSPDNKVPAPPTSVELVAPGAPPATVQVPGAPVVTTDVPAAKAPTPTVVAPTATKPVTVKAEGNHLAVTGAKVGLLSALAAAFVAAGIVAFRISRRTRTTK